jgi:hypothetical protein
LAYKYVRPGESILDLGTSVTMYRHSGRQVEAWVAGSGFTMLRSLAFRVPMDREGTSSRQIRAYLAGKERGDTRSPSRS